MPLLKYSKKDFVEFCIDCESKNQRQVYDFILFSNIPFRAIREYMIKNETIKDGHISQLFYYLSVQKDYYMKLNKKESFSKRLEIENYFKNRELEVFNDLSNDEKYSLFGSNDFYIHFPEVFNKTFRDCIQENSETTTIFQFENILLIKEEMVSELVNKGIILKLFITTKKVPKYNELETLKNRKAILNVDEECFTSFLWWATTNERLHTFVQDKTTVSSVLSGAHKKAFAQDKTLVSSVLSGSYKQDILFMSDLRLRDKQMFAFLNNLDAFYQIITANKSENRTLKIKEGFRMLSPDIDVFFKNIDLIA